MSQLPPITVQSSEGKVLHGFWEKVSIYLGGEETGDKFASFVEVTPPGGGPTPHYHESEDDWFFPFERCAEFFLDETWEELPMGTIVFRLAGLCIRSEILERHR